MTKLNLNFKQNVHRVNLELHHLGLAVQDFGNASVRFYDECLIKPSGVDLQLFKPEHVVSVGIENGIFSGQLKPSTDTPTHLKLYRSFEDIGGVVHTHSPYATAWAQAVRPIPCIGTTHADYWKGEIPVTRPLTDEEINGEYELETGKVIVDELKRLKLDPLDCPAILVAHHGPFAWGRTVEDALNHAEILEYIAKLAWMTLQINQCAELPAALHQRHFSRKHGPSAYYGQNIL